VSSTVSFQQLDIAAQMKEGRLVAAPSGRALWWSDWLGIEQSNLLLLQLLVMNLKLIGTNGLHEGLRLGDITLCSNSMVV